MIDFQYKDYYDVADLRKLIAVLRGENGCPWDKEQTHESIRRNFLEETYEVCEAIDEGNPEHLKEELGDVLTQVVFHAGIEEDAGRFNLDDVADAVCKKLIYRHPHIFGDTSVKDSDEVLVNWDELKRAEKKQHSTGSAMDSVAKSLPGTWRADKIQSKARKAGFDWPDISGALDKLYEEVGELKNAIETGEGISEELGDVLFSAVNVARLADVDAEDALHSTCDKFVARYRSMEQEAEKRGLVLDKLTLDKQEELYQEAKKKL